MAADPVRVLFVCMGNICRSPVAEAVFRHQVREAGLEDRFEIDSAGTSGYHDGDPPDRRSTETAWKRGIKLTGRSRRVTQDDLRTFDYVIAMDAENERELRRVLASSGGAARVHRLREWDPRPEHGDVPDPYYGGARGFDDVHDIVERASAAFLEHVVREHGLRG
ncbi:low molecular weight protein-tyrosine-phosphatase [Longimicrobium sp.]|uniref:low molecular weight protein-tyrosine-phosphatase n=1 Tax=Longimicrobium sp. TaxID=2029185 RepID=UPI002E34EE35|nr:low molecular weight protein-tyrosine-phosphatase [Longimicrobium sp.]HEX6042418.1 low molecular weight protein-tyrosine-phosphatase [Longimicrobium sp.]